MITLLRSIFTISLVPCLISFKISSIPRVRTAGAANDAEFFAIDFVGLVEQEGYQAEWHNVTTPDGYTLSIFRVLPHSKSSKRSTENSVIFLQHGIGESADGFVLFGPNISIAYMLSDAGYDVWIGNVRGNVYSRTHKSLSSDDPKFWDFSVDEHAVIDLPTMLDYVLETTQTSSMSYIGHSMGGAVVLMLLSERTMYNEKLKQLVLLQPAVFSTIRFPARQLVATAVQFVRSVYPDGLFEMASANVIIPTLIKYICPLNQLTLGLCYQPYAVFFGDHPQSLKNKALKYFLHFPTGTSAKALYFYLQRFENDTLQHYDYGEKALNLQHYGQTTPPIYNLKNVTTSVAIFHALNDPIATGADIKKLMNELPNCKKLVREDVEDEKFNHLDFLIADNTKEAYIDRILQILAEEN